MSLPFPVSGAFKHPVYYFILSLLVLFLAGHVTRSGACDWLAGSLSLSSSYLMAESGVDGGAPVRFGRVGPVWQLLREDAAGTAGRTVSSSERLLPPHRPPRREVPAPAAAHTTFTSRTR